MHIFFSFHPFMDYQVICFLYLHCTEKEDRFIFKSLNSLIGNAYLEM